MSTLGRLLVLTCLLGCAGPAATGSEPRPGARAGEDSDPAIAAALEMRDIRRSEVGAAMAVDFELRNHSDAELEFQWCVVWIDRSGAELALGETRWTRAELDPGASQQMRIVAPVPEAHSWRLRVER